MSCPRSGFKYNSELAVAQALELEKRMGVQGAKPPENRDLGGSGAKRGGMAPMPP